MDCICEKERCTGCGACEKACPESHIKMMTDFDGFRYREIDSETDCSKCKFKCPQNNDLFYNETSDVYAMQLDDSDVLLKSTSGGMFYSLSKCVIDHGGTVFGAVYDKDMKVVHVAAETIEQLDKMHGSKYVQSDISEVYNEIKSLLDKNKLVLFTGLPCQVAGIRAFIGENSKNLITMDLICSGVPSPLLFKEYINYIQKKKNIKIIDYKFRDKHKNGCSHTVVIKYLNRFGKIKSKTISDRRKVSYYVAFGEGDCYMKACYSCKYNSLSRVSDFTVGGFWGLKHTKIDLDEKKGVSLALVNTDAAKKTVASLKYQDTFEKSDIEYGVIGNPALIESTPYSETRDLLYKDLKTLGYYKTSRKYFKHRNASAIWLRKIIGKLIFKFK